jgi:hypothetical protein
MFGGDCQVCLLAAEQVAESIHARFGNHSGIYDCKTRISVSL